MSGPETSSPLSWQSVGQRCGAANDYRPAAYAWVDSHLVSHAHQALPATDEAEGPVGPGTSRSPRKP